MVLEDSSLMFSCSSQNPFELEILESVKQKERSRAAVTDFSILRANGDNSLQNLCQICGKNKITKPRYSLGQVQFSG